MGWQTELPDPVGIDLCPSILWLALSQYWRCSTLDYIICDGSFNPLGQPRPFQDIFFDLNHPGVYSSNQATRETLSLQVGNRTLVTYPEFCFPGGPRRERRLNGADVVGRDLIYGCFQEPWIGICHHLPIPGWKEPINFIAKCASVTRIIAGTAPSTWAAQ